MQKYSKLLSDLVLNRVNRVSYEIYSTFLSNYIYCLRTQSLGIYIDGMFSHSAGIFNILVSSGAVSLEKMFDFMIERNKIFDTYSGSQSLVLYVTSNKERLFQLLRSNHINFDEAIINSKNSGVMDISAIDVERVREIARNNQVLVKFHTSGIPVPYHTKYLSKYFDVYEKLVDQLFTVANLAKLDNFDLLLESQNIKTEIIRQLDGTVHWSKLLNNLIKRHPKYIYDSSANEFLKKQCSGKSVFLDMNILGVEIWKK